MTRWDDAVVIVTGASRGIGRAIAVAAGARGARLGLIARSKSELGETLGEAGGDGAVAIADVAVRDEVETAVASLSERLGAPTILVNNAGIGGYGAFAEADWDDIERMMRINYLGTVYATKACLPAMLERGSGHIVNIASIAGRIGAPLEGAYSASKFAMAGLSESLSFELANRGVRVTMVNPGPVATDFFDARGVPYRRKRPKPVTPEAVARATLRAVEKHKAEVFIPRWLRFPAALKVVAPPAFRAGTLRDYRDELPR